MNTDDLIDRLGREATVVRPLPAPAVRSAAWALWAAAYLVGVASLMFAMTSRSAFVLSPLYLLQQGAALVMGLAAARASLVSSVPGRQTRARSLALAGLVSWIALLVWQAVADVGAGGSLGLAAETDWPCVASMTLGTIVLGGPLLRMLRRGAPLTPRGTVFFGALAALSLANIQACLTRPHTYAATVLLWHGGTAALLALTCVSAAPRWLRWPDRPGF